MNNWIDITGSFAARDEFLDLAREGKAIVRRKHNGWFGKKISAGESSAKTGNAPTAITGAPKNKKEKS